MVTGYDLLVLGLAQGPIYSRLLTELYRRQLNGQFADRTAAVEFARTLIDSSF